MIDIAKFATNLEPDENGIWSSRNRTQVFYPEEGNEWCLEVENPSFWFEHRNRCVTTVIRNFAPSGAVFDVGGGNGFVALAIQAMGVDVVLVEPGMAGAVNGKNRGLKSVICSTLEDAGFRRDSIPAIGLFDVVEHIEGEMEFLNSARDILAPGGRLYLTVPAYNFLWSSEDEFAQHHRRYTTSNLTEKLERAGFVVEFATYIFAFLPLPIFLFRTIPSKLKGGKSGLSDQSKQEHEMQPGVVGGVLGKLLEKELRLLEKGRRIPFGGSCLAVARKP